jgi:xanthine/CO dehydrogenase XdhC/CoxF family maturation factor
VAEEKIATVHAPAGLFLGASTPEEIALSVMSQMVALRRGVLPHSLPEDRFGRDLVTDEVIRHCEADVVP